MTFRAPPPLDLSGQTQKEALCRYSDWTELAWFPHLGSHGMDERASDLFVMSLGLAGEGGELQEAVADENLAAVRKELGDVIYYWGRLTGFYHLDVDGMVDAAQASPVSENGPLLALRLGQWIGRSVEIIKKSVRDDGLDRERLQSAMAKTLSYWLATCQAYNLDSTTILQASADKITSRHAQGTLRGSDQPDGRRTHTMR